MRKAKIGRHTVELFDSIEEMPIARYHRFNRYLLVDSGIGGSVADVDQHLAKTIGFLKTDDKTSAIQELENMRQCIHLLENGVSPKNMAFACIVRSIDGVATDDISDTGVTDILQRLEDISVKELASQLEESKKKIEDELCLYFPSSFDTNSQKEYYQRLKEMLLDELEGVDGNLEAIARAEVKGVELMTYSRPRKYDGSHGAEVAYDKEYEQMCLVISSECHIDAKQMTVLEFYSAYEHLKEKARKLNAHSHR